MSVFRRALTVASAFIFLLVAACAAGQDASETSSDAASGGSTSPSGPITVTHAQGTVDLEGPAQRVVVLEYGTLDTISAIGAQDVVVGLPKADGLPEVLSEFSDDKYADVGTLFEPNIEAIAALEPDLVIAGFRSAKAYEELAKHFPTVDISFERSDDFVADVSYSAKIVGEALGKSAEVEAQIDEVSKAMEAAKGKVPADATAMILMTSGGKVSLSGAKSRFGLIHNDLGFVPAISEADAEANAHGEAISFEAIAQANPEWMFVIDRDAAIGESGDAAEQVLDNELVAGTKAWSEKNVVYLDGARWYILIHGVDNAVEMIDEVAAAF